jgi:hypothetical protein
VALGKRHVFSKLDTRAGAQDSQSFSRRILLRRRPERRLRQTRRVEHKTKDHRHSDLRNMPNVMTPLYCDSSAHAHRGNEAGSNAQPRVRTTRRTAKENFRRAISLYNMLTPIE